jgi:hypothetical protein
MTRFRSGRFRSGIVTVSFVLFLIACDSTGPTDGPAPGPLPEVFAANRSWTYDYTFTQTRPDGTLDTTVTGSVRVRVTDTSASVGPWNGLVETETVDAATPDDVKRTWYLQTPDSLTEVAYQNAGAAPAVGLLRPASAQVRSLQDAAGALPSRILQRRLAQRVASPAERPAARDTTVRLREDARLSLRRPLATGQSWIGFRDPFVQERTVRGRETTSTPAGAFEAVLVESTLPERAPSFQSTEYVTKKGLVRRIVTDTLEMRDPDGTVVGSGTVREEFVLTSLTDPAS